MKLRLSLAVDYYDRTIPLLDGSVEADGLDLTVLSVRSDARHHRMLNHHEFDVAELSLSSYLMAKDRGAPLTAIPVIPRRLFSQPQMFVNPRAGIHGPGDLAGKRVGLSSYQNTLGVLAKGDLATEYGVPLNAVTWVTGSDETVPFEPPTGVRIERAAHGVRLDAQLTAGEIDALLVSRTPEAYLRGDERIARLFPDPRAETVRFFQKVGFYPIMHLVAIRSEIIESSPWVARSVFNAFERAKQVCFLRYDDPNFTSIAAAPLLREDELKVFGPDPWPNGLARNRANLERFVQYSYDQGLISRLLTMEDLFTRTLLDS